MHNQCLLLLPVSAKRKNIRSQHNNDEETENANTYQDISYNGNKTFNLLEASMASQAKCSHLSCQKITTSNTDTIVPSTIVSMTTDAT